MFLRCQTQQTPRTAEFAPSPRARMAAIHLSRGQAQTAHAVQKAHRTSSSLDASRMYCLSRCILSLNRYIATARPPIWAEDANPGGPVTSPTAKTRGFDVRKVLSTCFDVDGDGFSRPVESVRERRGGGRAGVLVESMDGRSCSISFALSPLWLLCRAFAYTRHGAATILLA